MNGGIIVAVVVVGLVIFFLLGWRKELPRPRGHLSEMCPLHNITPHCRLSLREVLNEIAVCYNAAKCHIYNKKVP